MSAGSKQYSASIAFTLALFSHLVNHVNIRLQAELEEGESQVPPLHTDAAGERGHPRLHRQIVKGTLSLSVRKEIWQKTQEVSKSQTQFILISGVI